MDENMNHDCEGAGGQLDYWQETFTCADCGAERAATADELADYRKMLEEDFSKHMTDEYLRDLQDTQDALES